MISTGEEINSNRAVLQVILCVGISSNTVNAFILSLSLK